MFAAAGFFARSASAIAEVLRGGAGAAIGAGIGGGGRGAPRPPPPPPPAGGASVLSSAPPRLPAGRAAHDRGRAARSVRTRDPAARPRAPVARWCSRLPH